MTMTLQTLIKYGCLLSFISLSPILEAKIYKWKDENGKIHFSDKPPTNEQITVEKREMKGSKIVKTAYDPNAISEIQTTDTKLKPKDRKLSSVAGNNRQASADGLTYLSCKLAVSNMKKGLPSFKSTLMKQTQQASLDPATNALIDSMLNELKQNLTIDDCLNSSAKEAKSYKCMTKTADLSKCI